jgi:hypothetical protein
MQKALSRRRANVRSYDHDVVTRPARRPV